MNRRQNYGHAFGDESHALHHNDVWRIDVTIDVINMRTKLPKFNRNHSNERVQCQVTISVHHGRIHGAMDHHIIVQFHYEF